MYWTATTIEAFKKLEIYLYTTPTLVLLDFCISFELQVDASIYNMCNFNVKMKAHDMFSHDLSPHHYKKSIYKQQLMNIILFA